MKIIIPILNKYKDSDYETAQLMVDSLWNRYCHNQGATSLPYWMDKFSSELQANRMILALVEQGVIKTTIKHNWAELSLEETFVSKHRTPEEINKLIKSTKMKRYLPKTETISTRPNFRDTKLTSGIKDSGIARFGFANAGKHTFTYDTDMMVKYKEEIVEYSVKSMVKMEAKLNKSLRLPQGYDYQSLIEDSIDYLIENPKQEFVLGKLVNDSRGRAIYECLQTIFNPLANKMARALVVAPKERVYNESIKSAHLFIAELYHGFNPDMAEKEAQGKACWKERKFHEFDMKVRLPNGYKANNTPEQCEAKREELKAEKREHYIDELHENIWLERLYNELDAYAKNPNHQITTPIEVDFSSSNMVMIGLLLGHSDYVDHTSYMWQVDGLTKQHVKVAQTPYVFGSSEGVRPLWKKNGLTFTAEQVKIMQREQSIGKFAIANELKDIIIGHCHPEPEMELCVQRENFTVECNKTKNVGDITKQYVVYSSETKAFSVITHTDTHKIPDLEQFKRYFMTGLIHNLDSQILDNICLMMEWILPIHDAGIVTWSGAGQMRRLAVAEMVYVKANRRETMVNFLKSINLDEKGWVRFARLIDKVEQLNEGKEMVISEYLLK